MNYLDNKRIYDENWAAWLDMKAMGPSSRWLRALVSDALDEINRDEVVSILDVGCGEGTNTWHLSNQFPDASVTGIDFSRGGIEAAVKRYSRPRLNFIVDEKSATLRSTFSMVVCLEVLEHVVAWEALIEKMVHSASHYLLLSTPVGRMRAFETSVGHLRNFQKGELEQAVVSYKFQPVFVVYAGFPFYSPLYRDLCNLTHVSDTAFARGRYAFRQKMISSILYFFFRYLSAQRCRGDQFLGLFKRSG